MEGHNGPPVRSESFVVKAEEYYISRGAVKVERVVAAEHVGGVSADNHSFTPFHPSSCQAVKVDGSACKARPVKHGMLCWFHIRQAERADL